MLLLNSSRKYQFKDFAALLLCTTAAVTIHSIGLPNQDDLLFDLQLNASLD